MMYLRILLLAFIFNKEVVMKLLIPLHIPAACSLVVGWYLYRRNRKVENMTAARQEEHHNPLEFRTAFLFAFLFVFFAMLTHFVFQYYGNGGLQALSCFVGVTDIDPILAEPFSGKANDTFLCDRHGHDTGDLEQQHFENDLWCCNGKPVHEAPFGSGFLCYHRGKHPLAYFFSGINLGYLRPQKKRLMLSVRSTSYIAKARYLYRLRLK